MAKKRKSSGRKKAEKPEVDFADIRPMRLDPKVTLPAKFQRMLDGLPLKDMFAGKKTAVKMHLGGNIGYSTVHPLFVRLLGEKLKVAGAKAFVTDGAGAVRNADARGYTRKTIGMPLVPVSGDDDTFFYTKKVSYRTLKKIDIAGEIRDADAMIVLSHAKGHGDCGYGGACKNIAMGCVTGRTRGSIHHLEGGLKWLKSKCVACGKCVEACPNNAAQFNEETKVFSIFYHNCTYCQHCALVCPKKAIKITGGQYHYFQEGMALCTDTVLKSFPRKSVLYINVLLNITVFCDCWGMTTPSIVPDIGIMASTDMVAIEQASLDAIKTKNFIKGSLPPGRKFGKGKHLFEKIHAKSPFVQLAALEKKGLGRSKYKLVTVP